MKLLKFRIQNYKSIKDSGWCWLASDITVLAGKNESGKSAILEALRDFGVEGSISDGAKPIDGDDDEPVIIKVCFQIGKESLDQVTQMADITINEKSIASFLEYGVTIIKQHSGYSLDEGIANLLNEEINKKNAGHIKEIKKVVDAFRQIDQVPKLGASVFNSSVESIQKNIGEYIRALEGQISSIPDTAIQEDARVAIEQLKAEHSALVLFKASVADKFLQVLMRHMPQFTFFSDFSDILPFETPLIEAEEHEIIRDFAKVAGISFEEAVAETDTQHRRNMLARCSARISGDFGKYWEQDHLTLVVEPAGDDLVFWVKEAGNASLFKAEQRSKGFQWFSSFYLRLSAGSDNARVILIDEPGMHLHAEAQEDVLNTLEKISESSQVVFSTHSPYLIDTQHLDRVRLVLKDDREGTRIENKIHKDADTETLTPIITAIGLDVSKGLLAREKNVLLEGISDYYYMCAMREYIGVDDTIAFIPCVGATKIPQVVSLCIGWGLDFVVVLDNDSGGKQTEKELKDMLLVEPTRIVSVSEEKGAIEDLFTKKDFNQSVLGGKDEEQSDKNSKLMHRKDKVLPAKEFLEKVQQGQFTGELSKNTTENFKSLFERINKGFLKKVSDGD